MKQISLNDEEIAIIQEGLLMYKRVILQEKSTISQGGQALSIAHKLVEEALMRVESLEKNLTNVYKDNTDTR
jgi:hypothetical protein